MSKEKNFFCTFWGLDNYPVDDKKPFFNPNAPLFGKIFFMKEEKPISPQTTKSDNKNIIKNQTIRDKMMDEFIGL